MPSAVAEAEAAARYVADVWRLITASRLHTHEREGRYPVILEDSFPKDNLVFGDLKEGYKFNFAMAPEVRSDESVGFRTGSTVYRVMALADGKPADKNALTLFTRDASGGGG